MTAPGDGSEAEVQESVVLAKYDQDTDGMTDEEISRLSPLEAIVIVNGEVVRNWKRGDSEESPTGFA